MFHEILIFFYLFRAGSRSSKSIVPRSGSWIFIIAVFLIFTFIPEALRRRLTKWSAEEAKVKSRIPRDAWGSRHSKRPKVAVRKARWWACPFFGPPEYYLSWSALYRNHHHRWRSHRPRNPRGLVYRYYCYFSFYPSISASCAAYPYSSWVSWVSSSRKDAALNRKWQSIRAMNRDVLM